MIDNSNNARDLRLGFNPDYRSGLHAEYPRLGVAYHINSNTFDYSNTLESDKVKDLLLNLGIALNTATSLHFLKDYIYVEQPSLPTNSSIDSKIISIQAKFAQVSSALQNADLPRVIAGAPVIAMIEHTSVSKITKYLENYLIIDNYFKFNREGSKNLENGVIIYGFSNSTEATDFKPFAEALEFVVLNKNMGNAGNYC